MILRIVVDTNVFVSSLYGGNPKRIINVVADDNAQLLYTTEMYFEYNAVLARRKFQFAQTMIDSIFELVNDKGEYVESNTSVTLSRDPSDNKFIECAIDGGADYIISGDVHLLEIKQVENIAILSPAEFLDRIKK